MPDQPCVHLPRGLGLAHSGVWESFVKHVKCAQGTRTRVLQGPDSSLKAMPTRPGWRLEKPDSQGAQTAPKGPPGAGHLTLCPGTDRTRPGPHRDFPGPKHFCIHGSFLHKY